MVVSPSLLVLGAQNWNLWTLAPVAAGLAAAARGRTARAGAWFGLAAGIKWWPALLVIPLIVGRWADQPAGPAGLRRRRRTAPAVAAAGTWALVQLPALAVSPANQWRSISFHLGREPNRGGHVAAALGLLRQAGVELSSDPGPVLDAVSLAVLVLGAAVVVRRLSRRLVDPVDAMLALVALFLVTSKIFSVQFVLWLLPLLVLRGCRRAGWCSSIVGSAVWLLYAPWEVLGDRYRHWAHAAALARAGWWRGCYSAMTPPAVGRAEGRPAPPLHSAARPFR